MDEVEKLTRESIEHTEQSQYYEQFRPAPISTSDILSAFKTPEVIAGLKEKRDSLIKQLNEKDMFLASRYEEIRRSGDKDSDVRIAAVEVFHEFSIKRFYPPSVCKKVQRYREPTAEDLEEELRSINRWIEELESSSSSKMSLEAIKDRIDISELASKYIKVNFSNSQKHHACCPFHEERSPSFVLYDDTNSFYCFGCQASGDIIDLLMKLEGVKFKEAVSILEKI